MTKRPKYRRSPQDVFLYRDIKSNIRLNNEDIPDEKIKEVAQHVNADHFHPDTQGL